VTSINMQAYFVYF